MGAFGVKASKKMKPSSPYTHSSGFRPVLLLRRDGVILRLGFFSSPSGCFGGLGPRGAARAAGRPKFADHQQRPRKSTVAQSMLDRIAYLVRDVFQIIQQVVS